MNIGENVGFDKDQHREVEKYQTEIRKWNFLKNPKNSEKIKVGHFKYENTQSSSTNSRTELMQTDIGISMHYSRGIESEKVACLLNQTVT